MLSWVKIIKKKRVHALTHVRSTPTTQRLTPIPKVQNLQKKGKKEHHCFQSDISERDSACYFYSPLSHLTTHSVSPSFVSSKKRTKRKRKQRGPCSPCPSPPAFSAWLSSQPPYSSHIFFLFCRVTLTCVFNPPILSFLNEHTKSSPLISLLAILPHSFLHLFPPHHNLTLPVHSSHSLRFHSLFLLFFNTYNNHG